MSNRQKPTSSTLDEVKSLIYVVLIALVIRSLVIELFFVPTGSMKATIVEGDYVFSTKYSYGYSRYSVSIPLIPNSLLDKIFTFNDGINNRIFASNPQRGDIVIFRPPMNMELLYIKRLIALPGEKVQLINDVIHINDQPITRVEVGEFTDEQGQKYRKYSETLPNGKKYTTYKLDIPPHLLNHEYSTTEAFYVPKDHYFFLGDNRDNSRDSRFELGYVPFTNFVSKGQFILFSTKEILWDTQLGFIEQIERIWLWLKSIRFNRILHRI